MWPAALLLLLVYWRWIPACTNNIITIHHPSFPSLYVKFGSPYNSISVMACCYLRNKPFSPSSVLKILTLLFPRSVVSLSFSYSDLSSYSFITINQQQHHLALILCQICTRKYCKGSVRVEEDRHECSRETRENRMALPRKDFRTAGWAMEKK